MTIAVSSLLPARIRGRISGLATLSRDARRSQPELVRCRAERIGSGKAPLRGLVGQAGAIFRHNAADHLRGLSVPTLVVHGGMDRLIDARNAEILVRLIPDARLELWEEAGHDLTTELPLRLSARIRCHVDEVIQRSRVSICLPAG